MIVSLIIVFLHTAAPIDAFQLPKIKFVGISENVHNIPKRSIESGDGEALRANLEKHCGLTQSSTVLTNESYLRWEPDLHKSYEVANVIFQEIVDVSNLIFICTKDTSHDTNRPHSKRIISCPSMSRPQDLQAIAKVLQSDRCKLLLGLESVSAELYPDSPSPYLQLTFSDLQYHEGRQPDEALLQLQPSETVATSNTENWVDNFLGKYNICPYTSSVKKAAVGLSSVQVPVGNIHIVVGSTNLPDTSKIRQIDYDILRSATLVSTFWSETQTLLQSSETEWATSLVVFPEYDDDFDFFIEVCDNIVQPMIEATSSTYYIGRAWFHPKYDADQVGHTSVIAGHAVPHKLVQEFVQTINGLESAKSITMGALGEANNKVRMTPHATINILRRSQLNAAAQYEKGLGSKRPKPNSIYVRNTLKLIELLKGTNVL
jgi:hypothetical protein